MRYLALPLLLLVLQGRALPEVPEGPLVVAYIEDSVEHRSGRAVMEAAYKRLGVEITFRGLNAYDALRASRSGEAGAELMRMDGLQLRYDSLVQVPIPIS